MLKVNLNVKLVDNKELRDSLRHVKKEMEFILNSPEFKEEVLKMDKKGELSDLKHKTNLEIYNLMMSGAEVLSPEVDCELDVEIDDYWSRGSAAGYTYSNTPRIWVNLKYIALSDFTLEGHHRKHVGSLILHEWTHKLGADHHFRYTSVRPYSISYRMNDIYERLWDKLIAPQLKPTKVVYSYRKWFKTYYRTVTELHGTI